MSENIKPSEEPAPIGEINIPESMRHRSIITIGGNGGLHISLYCVVPNRFWRWMHYVFFGFTWRAFDE